MKKLKKQKNVSEIFYTVDEIKQIYRSFSDCQVVVWGTGNRAEDVLRTLNINEVPVAYFGDNDVVKQGQYLLDKKIIGKDELKEIKFPFIVMGCGSSFIHIYNSLTKDGFHNIYAIKDLIKYSYQDILEDKNFLVQYINNYETMCSDKILVEMYGHIGDILIDISVLKYFFKKYQNCVYVLVEKGNKEEVVRLVTDQIIVIDNKSFIKDKLYRREFLQNINSHYFVKSFIISEMKNAINERVLNKYNFNVKKVISNYFLENNSEYRLDLTKKFLHDYFGKMEDINLSPKYILNDAVEKIKFDYVLPSKYVVIHLGSLSSPKYYDTQKFLKVVKYLLDRNYKIVMIGYGEYDERCYKEIQKVFCDDKRIVSFVSRLSVLESFYVVLKSLFFVGTDSSMWNAAYVLGKASVVVYSGGDYSFKHKDPSIHYAKVADKACRNCIWFCTHKTENGYSECMDEITPELIIEKIKEIEGKN